MTNEWVVPSTTDPNKKYTVKWDSKLRLTCDCKSWVFNQRGDRTCKHTDKINREISKGGDSVKKPTEYNGYKVGDRVKYVSEFENSKAVGLDVGDEGNIVGFLPSPKYTWIAEVFFESKLGTTSWHVPLEPKYLERKGKIKVETKKTTDEVRDDLWRALMT